MIFQMGLKGGDAQQLQEDFNLAVKFAILYPTAMYFAGTPRIRWDFVKFISSIPNAEKYFENANKLAELDAMRISIMELGLGTYDERRTRLQGKLEDYYDRHGDILVRFKSPDAFFQLNRELAPRMSDGMKIATLAFWSGELEEKYGGSIKPMSAGEVIGKFISGSGEVGICGNINGAFQKELARSLGLEHASVGVFTKTAGPGHIVGFVKGGEEYFLVDYGHSERLGKNPDAATERIFQSYGFSPFSFATDKATFFYTPQSERILLATLGWAKNEIEKKFGVSTVISDSGAGFRLEAPMEMPFANLAFGVFALGSSFSIKQAFGAQARLKFHTGDGESAWGVLELPSLDFTYVNMPLEADSEQIMARFEPLALDLSRMGNFSFRLEPLKAIGVTNKKMTKMTGKLESAAGFACSVSEFGEFYSKVDIGWPPSSEVYDIKLRDAAYRGRFGFRNETTQIEARIAPQSMMGKYELEAKHHLIREQNLDLLIYAMGTRNDGIRLSGGMQLSFRPF